MLGALHREVRDQQRLAIDIAVEQVRKNFAEGLRADVGGRKRGFVRIQAAAIRIHVPGGDVDAGAGRDGDGERNVAGRSVVASGERRRPGSTWRSETGSDIRHGSVRGAPSGLCGNVLRCAVGEGLDGGELLRGSQGHCGGIWSDGDATGNRAHRECER